MELGEAHQSQDLVLLTEHPIKNCELSYYSNPSTRISISKIEEVLLISAKC
jgi:hypothetical protein